MTGQLAYVARRNFHYLAFLRTLFSIQIQTLILDLQPCSLLVRIVSLIDFNQVFGEIINLTCFFLKTIIKKIFHTPSLYTE